jgi:hypothetical protein
MGSHPCAARCDSSAAQFTSVAPVGGEALGLVELAVVADAPTLELPHTIQAYPTFR